NMSHEFRTPLNAIIGYSELVIEQAEDTGDVELTQDVHNIRVAGEHLLTLVTDILDLSKIEAGRLELQLETFSVRALLDEVNAAILPIATANRNRLEIRCADDVGEMHSDPTRIRQALINVLGNACKFTADGLVRVTVSRRPALESDFSVLGTGVPIVGTDCVEFVVEDTGIGMTSSQISRLFENFSQADAGISRRFGGTGLGLVISRRLCRLMGGEIFATSEFGVGSTFRIALPAEISEEASAEVDVTDRPIAVFMGQNLDTLREIGEKLEPHAIDVTRGRDIEDAEALVASRGEVLIVDEIVVQEPSSWLTLAELRQAAALRPIPVVAYISDISGQFGRALDVVDVLARPLRADALFEALRRLGAGEPTAVRSNDPALVEQAQAILASASANADAEPQDDGDLEWTLEIVDVSLPGVDARGIFPNEEAPREGDERVYTIIAVPSSGDELTLHRLNENTEKLLDLRPLPRGYMIDEVCAFIRDRLGR
ncbi:MAG: hypothetical protein KC636_01445, partial [Myxococcales bacterium]|nr:hypothetical protein [Myxococcales bacterium]